MGALKCVKIPTLHLFASPNRCAELHIPFRPIIRQLLSAPLVMQAQWAPPMTLV